MAKKEETPKVQPTFREQLTLAIAAAKARGVTLDEIESALHCEVDSIITAKAALNAGKRKKA
jgi:hypothetical protein